MIDGNISVSTFKDNKSIVPKLVLPTKKEQYKNYAKTERATDYSMTES